MSGMPQVVDYVCIGNFCFDEDPEGLRLGGISYAAMAAKLLGATVGVLTSGSPRDRVGVEKLLSGVHVCWVDALHSTIFRNIYSENGCRTQYVVRDAGSLRVEQLPPGWESARIVHLGPFVDEVPIDFVNHISPQSIVGVTPQGWLRRLGRDGLVERRKWDSYSKVLERADVLVFSQEDTVNEEEMQRYVDSAKMAVVTRAAQGADVTKNGVTIRIPAVSAIEVDPTGAGDVFAAAFFIELWRSGSPIQAGRFAASAAAFAVEGSGVSKLATEEAVRRRM